MNYSTPEDKKKFSGAASILHMVCMQFDFECAQHNIQVHFIDCYEDEAYLGIEKIRLSVLNQICVKVNSVFRRKDGKNSIEINCAKSKIVKCFATKPEDLAHLN